MWIEVAALVTLVINTILTGLLGYAALRVTHELEEMNEEDDA